MHNSWKLEIDNENFICFSMKWKRLTYMRFCLSTENKLKQDVERRQGDNRWGGIRPNRRRPLEGGGLGRTGVDPREEGWSNGTSTQTSFFCYQIYSSATRFILLLPVARDLDCLSEKERMGGGRRMGHQVILWCLKRYWNLMIVVSRGCM